MMSSVSLAPFFFFFFSVSYLTYVIFRSYGNHACKQHKWLQQREVVYQLHRDCSPPPSTLVPGAHFPVSLCLMSLRLGSSPEQIKKKNINKPNYTRARSLFCVQTTPGLPMNGQGPHTDPCCSLTWYDSEKENHLRLVPFFSHQVFLHACI